MHCFYKLIDPLMHLCMLYLFCFSIHDLFKACTLSSVRSRPLQTICISVFKNVERKSACQTRWYNSYVMNYMYHHCLNASVIFCLHGQKTRYIKKPKNDETWSSIIIQDCIYIFYMTHVKLEISRCYVLKVESHR